MEAANLTDVQPYFPHREHVNLPVGEVTLGGTATVAEDGAEGKDETEDQDKDKDDNEGNDTPKTGTGVTMEVVDGDADPLATLAAQVSNDHIYMTAYRVSLDETEPDYALTFPSQAKENDSDNLKHNLSRLNDSDALRVATATSWSSSTRLRRD